MAQEGKYEKGLACADEEHVVHAAVQRRLAVHGQLGVVRAPLEQQGAAQPRLHLLEHEWVPAHKVQHVVRQVKGRVHTLGPQPVCDALETEREGERER